MNTTTSPTSNTNREYLHTLVAGAWLPLLQSTIVALVVFIGTWVIAYMVFDAQDPHKSAILLGVITWVYMLIKLQRHWLSLTAVEQIIQRDLNGDGVIGEATEQPKEVKPRRVVIQIDKVKEDGHYQVGDTSALIKLSCSDEQLFKLAQGLMSGMPFSEKTWTGEGKPFASNEFRELRAEMKRQNLVEYISDKDHRQGMRLTDTGRAVMEDAAASPTPL